MHVVVVGCGRVGSALATSLVERGPHRRIIDKRSGGVRPPRRRLRGPGDRSASASTATGSNEAGIETRRRAVAAVTNGDNSNIMIARVAAGDVRRRAGRRPHLRPPAGRRSTSASASPRSPRCRGRPSGCCAASCPTRRPSSGSTRAPRCAWSSGRSPARGRARAVASSSEAARSRVVARRPRSASAQLPEPDLVAQEGDVVYVAVAGDAHRRRSTTVSAEPAQAGGH